MTTNDRITVLETQLRAMKRMIFGLCAVIAAGFLVGATSMQGVPDVIEAKSFHVVNDAGKKLVSLEKLIGGGVDNGQIVTWTSTGQPLVGLSAGPGGGTVNTTNGKGQMLVELGATQDHGMVTTWNSSRKVIVELGAGESGGIVSVRDHQGRNLAQVISHKDGKGGVLQTMNPAGGILVQIGMTDEGFGSITTQNGDGGTLTELGSTKEGAGMVFTENGTGKVLVEIGGTGPFGSVRTANLNGQTLVLLSANKSSGVGGVLTYDGKGRVTSVTPAP